MLLGVAILGLGLTYLWVYVVATHGPRLFGRRVHWFERVESLGQKAALAAQSIVLTLLVAFAFGVAASFVSPSETPTTRVLVGRNSPASRAGMKNGDRIVAVGTQRIESFDRVQEAVRSGQSPLRLEVQREGRSLHLEVVPENARLGVRVIMDEKQRTLPEAVTFATATFRSTVARSLSPRAAAVQVAGPVSILREVVRSGRQGAVLVYFVMLQAGFLLLVPLIHLFDLVTQLLSRRISAEDPVRRDVFHLYVLGVTLLLFTASGVLQEWRSTATSTAPLLDLVSQACSLSLTLASFTALKRHLSLRTAGTLSAVGAFVGPILWVGTAIWVWRQRANAAKVAPG